MEYLRSSQSARTASWILREIVRSWVRNRFLASCWVSVEPPSTPAVAGHVAHDRPRYADRIDAEMRVESPVLDRDEGLGQIGRKVDEPDRGAAGVAAIGDERAVVGEDGDIGRALGHRELVDRRQLARFKGDKPGERDDAPDAEHAGPVEGAAERGPSRPPPALPAAPRSLCGLRPARRGRAVGGIGAQVVVGLVAPVEARLDPRPALAGASPEHDDPAREGAPEIRAERASRSGRA